MRLRFHARALLAAALFAAGPAGARTAPDAREPLGLFGTIPLYWGEPDGMAEVLAGTAPPHWVRAVLERDHQLHPLPTLSTETLAPVRLLLIAQPRVLSPQENVALDAWVRGGGRLLLFADPLLTGESHYPLGDRRRPQDVVLLSPLLAHWGLQLRFDPDQPAGIQTREIAGAALPVNLAGHLALLVDDGTCGLQVQGFVAECAIGSGRAVIVADAAVLDAYHPAAGSGEAVRALAARAFAAANSLENNGFDAPVSEGIVDKSVQNTP